MSNDLSKVQGFIEMNVEQLVVVHPVEAIRYCVDIAYEKGVLTEDGAQKLYEYIDLHTIGGSGGHFR